MIREDRELLAELARVNSDVVPLAMRVMDDSASAEEQHDLAVRLIDIGQRLDRRAQRRDQVIEIVSGVAVLDCTVPYQEP